MTGQLDFGVRRSRLHPLAALSADELARFDRELAFGAAAVLATRVHGIAKLAENDQPPLVRWRRRAQLVQQIHVFEGLARRAGTLPALTGWFTRLANAMTERWEDATTPAPPLFPAFLRPG